MRLDIQFIGRVGIFQGIFLVCARHSLNIVAVEVALGALDIFVDAPAPTVQDLPELCTGLLRLPGVRAIANVDILPSARRRL
jgi:transcriptional regulator of aromatic amino acid metabolism